MHKFIGKFFLGIFVIGIFSIGSLTFAATCSDMNKSDPVAGHTWSCDSKDYDCTIKYPGTQKDTEPGLCGGKKIICSVCKPVAPAATPAATTTTTTPAAVTDSCPGASTNYNTTTKKCEDGYSCQSSSCKCNKPYTENSEEKCCVGTLLNTNVPFIGQCISFGKDGAGDGTEVTETTAFPRLMGGLTKMMVTVILLISFIAILAGGVMVAASGGSDTNAKKGKELIGKVIIAIAILGASGVILRLINPNFFK